MALSQVYIGGRRLTIAELTAFDAVQAYAAARPGEVFAAEDVFPARDNRDNAARRTIRRLARAGILSAGEVCCTCDRGSITMHS
jgi:hypothetical protein